MKLAKALLLRADRQRAILRLTERAKEAARYQEGDDPPEDANELIAEASAALDELEDLIRRINDTNSTTVLPDGRTLTAALAERDVLTMRHTMLSSIADAGSGPRGGRQLRSELRTLVAVPVAELRDRADDVARRRRELDAVIQQANWATDLIGPDGEADG